MDLELYIEDMKKNWVVIAILALAQFVMVLDSTVMNVSMSQVAADLHTSITAMQAAITFYALTMAALMLTGGKLGDIWGRRRAFKIGSVVYGVGSLMTGLAPNIAILMLGWSLIEGLGAVLVVPAIAVLAAANYTGKARAAAFAIIGGISGAAAAAGPLIGGLVTTYASWRYVFIAETIIMLVVLLVANKIADQPITKKQKLDIPSAILSATGMAVLVYGILQSKVWGWVTPKTIPTINGHEIAPFGISIVAYLILAGVVILAIFFNRQNSLKEQKKQPLLDTAVLKIKLLRSGLAVLMSQYLIIAAVFFVIPVYLQVNLGYDALKTGLKILPLSVALILFSVIGMRLAGKLAARRVVRIGQALLVIGSLILMGSINVELKGALFASGMFVLGAGLGLLASQLGNINMSSVDESKTTEVGGLQGTFQNLGSSLGTALIGSVFIAALSSGFVTGINQSAVSNQVKDSVNANSSTSLQIVSASQAQDIATSKGVNEQHATEVSNIYNDSQLSALQEAMFFLAVIALFSIILSRNLPSKRFG